MINLTIGAEWPVSRAHFSENGMLSSYRTGSVPRLTVGVRAWLTFLVSLSAREFQGQPDEEAIMKILALSSNDMDYVPSVIGGVSGIEVETLSTRDAPFPHTPHHRLGYAQHHVDLVKNHPLDDVDAIFLDTFGDYGVDAVRSVTGLPVFGAGESSLLVAHSLAPRFAIVTVWPESMRYIYAERLQATRTENACAGILHVTKSNESPDIIYEETRAREGRMRDLVLSAARQAVSDLDVDAVIFGCTCMTGMYDYIREAVPVPVLCAARTGLGFMLGAAACGWRQSSRMVPHDGMLPQEVCVAAR